MAAQKKRRPSSRDRSEGRMDASSGSGVAERSEHRARAERTAESERKVQRHVDQKDQEKQSAGKSQGKSEGKSEGKQKAVQAGDVKKPAPPMPAQHQQKPGHEKDLEPRPSYEAPTYKGSDKLLDMAAIITGGDSGIGRAVAVLFAREGADVAIVYLDEHDDAEETRRAVEKEGRRAILLPGDVADQQFCDDAVERTLQEFGKLDILVNNAAFQEHADSLEDITEEHFDRTFRTNIYGYFHMAKAALPHLKNGSAIINTGSVTGIEGSAKLLDYSATKGAIHAFTKSLAQNLVEKGIRVNCVAPGPVWTPLNPADSPPEKVAKFGSDVPMGRPAQPDELSPTYVYLAAPSCSSYITGEVIPVLGGKTV